MPLRDHFRSPLNDKRSWDELHGAWPTTIVMDLNERLPARYVAGPRIHLGVEIDVAALETDDPRHGVANPAGNGGGTATATWAPPQPTLSVATELPEQDEYEVLIHEDDRGRRLVAAVEIVSPANKDRPENRGAFVAKCAALLTQGVSVAIVDVVTTRRANLYRELLDLIGMTDTSIEHDAPSIYASACRWRRERTESKRAPRAGRLDTWLHPVRVGETLPTLPLWLEEDFAVPLQLEATYEQACRLLRIA